MSDLAFFRNDLPFSAYSTSHSVVMLIAVALIALIFVANKKLNYQQNLLIGRSLSLLLALTVVVYTIFEIVFGRFTIAEDLP
ncbi:MAG: hypothetical protein ACPHX1_02645, partial [Porticoccaceae bacterium]